MRRKTAAISATQLAEHFLHGPGEVTRRVHAASAADAGLLEILQNDHRVVMERLDNLIAAGGRDLAAMRADFLEMKCWLEAHSLAEERVLYARLKAREETAPLILAAAFADHEMVARTLENMGSLDLNAKQWMTLATALREMLQEHVETEEGEIFTIAQKLFDDSELKDMGGQMQFEKTRLFSIVA
jgi:hemerythrin superfamily protein